jgi:arylsulfatase A-like enzyme
MFILFPHAWISCTQKSAKADFKLPNVILINVDDLGWKDLGYMGAEFYETPNIDKLAKQGVVFNQAYSGASNCAPSRANMLAGRYSMSHGVYTVHPAERGNAKKRQLIPSHSNRFIPKGTYTLGNFFKDNGYVTGTFGKWHISESPHDFGFDVNVGGGPQGNPGKDGFFSPYNVEHISSEREKEYLTDRLTDEAIQFMVDNKKRQFFLYLPFYTVHTPLMAKDEDLTVFMDKKGKPGRKNITYAAMIYNMDKNVGRILNKIDSLGLSKNTIIIFTSDNGGLRSISFQDPLRGGKGSYYEGGIRVPLIISWKGKYVANVVEEPVSQIDFFPTLASIIGADMEALPLDGKNILPLLEGKMLDERDLFWHFPIYIEADNPNLDQSRDPWFRTRPGSVIRSGNWKLHQYFEDGSLELYNLSTDPSEKINLKDSVPQILNQIFIKLEKLQEKHQAPIPNKLNPEYIKSD